MPEQSTKVVSKWQGDPNPDKEILKLARKISWLVEYLNSDYGFSLKESLDHIYHSTLYKRLATADTLYWQLSPVDLYEELKTEISA